MKDFLVLTWTISPSGNVAGSLNISYSHTINPKEREKEYYYAIKYYLEKSEFDTVIFCDNSNYKFSYAKELYELAKEQWKTLELLSFQWDIYLSTQISYGAWEAEILDYIYDNSKYIKNTKSRFKITWRYIIDNINEIIIKLKDKECYFNKYGIRTTPFHVATSFFKISNKIYEKYLYKKTNTCFLLIKQWHNNTMLQLEQVRYILLRDYILNYYIKTKFPNIPIIISHMLFNRNKFLLITFKICVFLWFLNFNRFYKVFDFLFLSKGKKDIIKKINY